MSDNRKEAEEKMAKAIFISADCWLKVFDLLPPSQLGLGIALISHRFDYYVDEHFKTRKWTLKFIQIGKIGENGTKEMGIINSSLKSLPIPQIQLPRKDNGFERIQIFFIDRNVIAFFHHFRRLFSSCGPINLSICTTNDRISELILPNIWPMLGKNICAIHLSAKIFRRLRKLAPLILNVIICSYFDEIFPEFPCDDNAMASDGQAVAKWLFTPLQNKVPKVLRCWLDTKDDGNLSSRIEAFKAAFASASSSVNFIVVIWFILSSFGHGNDSVVPFVLTNELTREQLALKRTKNCNCFLFVRCPIGRDEGSGSLRRGPFRNGAEKAGAEVGGSRDESKWEEEAIGWQFHDQWNQIDIGICNDDGIGDGLLDETPGPSDQQK